MAKFSAEIAAHVERYKRRLRAVAKEATQETVAMAQKPRGNGGRMRVDTGFLRGSIAGNVGSMPSGRSTNDGETFTYDGAAVAAALLEWNPEAEEVLYVGWTANYARPREYHDGFLRGAVEKWDLTVNKVALEVKQRI